MFNNIRVVHSRISCCIYQRRTLFNPIVIKSMSSVDNYFKFLESAQFQEVLSFSEHELEGCHNFIQWTFPTTTPSAFNDDAPVIKVSDLRKHEKFPIAQDKIKLSLNVMRNHWGLNADGTVDTSKVRRLNGHNGLRFSRVVQSLVFHDLEVEARSLLSQALNVSQEYVRPAKQGDKTIWEIRLEQAVQESDSM